MLAPRNGWSRRRIAVNNVILYDHLWFPPNDPHIQKFSNEGIVSVTSKGIYEEVEFETKFWNCWVLEGPIAERTRILVQYPEWINEHRYHVFIEVNQMTLWSEIIRAAIQYIFSCKSSDVGSILTHEILIKETNAKS